jgi:hypothetical protein
MIWGERLRAHGLGVNVEEGAAEADAAAARHYQQLAEEWRAKYMAAERVIRTMSERSVEERQQLAQRGVIEADRQEDRGLPRMGAAWWFAFGATCAGLVVLGLKVFVS